MGNDLVEKTGARENFSMLAVTFEGVDGGNVPLSALQIKGFAGCDSGEQDPHDVLQIWNNATCSAQSFFYCNEEGLEGWWECGLNQTMEEALPDGIEVGKTMWYVTDSRAENRDGELSITFSGAVDQAESVTWDLVSSSGARENFSMLANPFPVAWKIAEGQCEITGFAACDSGEQDPHDVIQIWNNATCSAQSFFYCNEEGLEGWWECGLNQTMEEALPNGVKAGNAFWLIADSRASNRDGKLSIKFYNTAFKK